MIVGTVRHRGLRRLIEDDDPRFLPPDLLSRVSQILAAVTVADDIEGFIADAPPGWRVHRLSGVRQAEWSVSISGNWRITFTIEGRSVEGLNMEDYH